MKKKDGGIVKKGSKKTVDHDRPSKVHRDYIKHRDREGSIRVERGEAWPSPPPKEEKK